MNRNPLTKNYPKPAHSPSRTKIQYSKEDFGKEDTVVGASLKTKTVGTLQ